MKKLIKKDFKKLCGEITVPSDKSISHRAVIFSSLAKGTSIIKNFSSGKDVFSSVKVISALGTDIEIKDNSTVVIKSQGKFCAPSDVLYCANSGTTMRLMAGILSGQNFSSTLTGDSSLSKRPMKRIIEPLKLMNADISCENNTAPIKISPSQLYAIDYKSELSSAQVKSCVLLAGLQAQGTTSFTEPYQSRNHTEIMLKQMGVNIETVGCTTKIQKSEPAPLEITVCADISSAAFFMCAALIVPNSKIILKNIGLNPTRTGIIDIIKKMNGNIEIINEYELSGEKAGDIKIEYSQLKSCTITKEIVPKLIDEIPIIAVLATQAQGQTIISGAQDLRNKESDRIKATVNELKKLAANIEETPDGMIITGKTKLQGGCEVQAQQDHRLAMSLYVAGLITEKEIIVDNFEWTNISFPEFAQLFEKIKK